jgi:hypothetical protein
MDPMTVVNCWLQAHIGVDLLVFVLFNVKTKFPCKLFEICIDVEYTLKNSKKR